MKDERKKCRVVSCEIFEKKEKNLKTHTSVCVFFWLCKCVKKIVSSDALELHMLKEKQNNTNELYPIHIKGTENDAELMSTKGQKNNFSLEFLARSEKSCSFHHFFEGSLTIFLSLSLRDAKTHKINFPTNEEPHHNLNNEQTTTTRKKKRDDDGENDDAFISSGAKSSSSSSVFFP